MDLQSPVSHTDEKEPFLGPRAKPDGILNPAGEVGWYLEREREQRGLTLDDAAAATGIHPYHLMAIEFGEMTNMPPRMEALEMVQAYANYLGFDPAPLLEHYITFLPQPEIAPRHHPANPAPMSSAKILLFGKYPKIPPLNIRLPSSPRIPGGRGGIVASVIGGLILFAGAGWMMASGPSSPSQPDVIAQSDADVMPTATTGPEAAEIKVTESPLANEGLAGLETSPPVSDTSDEPAGDLGAFISEKLGDEASPESVASTTEPPAVVKTEGRIFGMEDPKSRVMIRATKSIWLLIEDGRGNRVATQLLNPGDMYRVPSRPGLVAIAQDGGALEYLIDGKERGLLGKPGMLLPAEPLDVSKLEAKG